MIFDATPEIALAIFAHPDDPEIACAGTLTRWAAAGCAVHLIIANLGEKGSSDPEADPIKLARQRAEEAAAAAKVMGSAAPELWGIPDGDLEDDAALRARLVEAVRRARPDVVVAPDPTAVFFGDGYINHHDHRALGWAVLDAIAPMAGSPLYVPGSGQAHQVTTLLLAGTLEPDTWVDIADHLDAKVAAVRCHVSQLGEGADVVADVVAERAAHAGDDGGLRYAEGFRRISF
ncbi:MAG: PIG-L deacetylase family protein [Acidimicrobiales bacterium]